MLRIILFIFINLLVTSYPLFAQDIIPLEFKSSDDPDHHVIELEGPAEKVSGTLDPSSEAVY